MVDAIRNAPWLTFFPDNYLWSFNAAMEMSLARAGGSDPGEVDRVIRALEGDTGDNMRWYAEWKAMGDQVLAIAGKAESEGRALSASAAYKRASNYYFAAERFYFPKDEESSATYRQVVECFRRATDLDPRVRVEHVDIAYEGSSLPAFFVPAPGAAEHPAPVVIFMNGFDGNKEMNWYLATEELLARGISVLALDSPGVGEAIRFRDIPLRHDYEVAASAALDWLESRSDVDSDRIGVMALSLGGYYAARSASMEHRLKACVSWGAIWDYHRIWRERIEAAFAKQLPVPGAHLVWSTGTTSTDEALGVLEGFRLDGVIQQMRCPFLLVHGEDDQQVPVADAHAMFEACGSEDKTIRVFSNEEGGAQHCHIDNLSIAVPFITDWLASKLGGSVSGRA
ncbi:prolyl oligopeptidase family serine peptidase [Pseudonocardia ailaonensis]|uniref:Prolyl oligopeptidase family serine peptidase n=1 Tax=Pseudonocardia ailaonensis TaxID=367279 RepID=A0ABN2N4N8_9PSEU